jgi:hypothetical protein
LHYPVQQTLPDRRGWGCDDQDPAPLRIVLGSDALRNTIATLQQRLAGFEAQTELAASTDHPPGQ